MLSLIMDIESGETKEEKKYNYIYLQNGDQLLKFKAEFEHMDVVNAIENYISSINVHNFKLVNEKEAKTLKTPLKFFPYVGKFRLENGLVRTQNYLVPQYFDHELLNLLNKKYKKSEITSKDLSNLYQIKQKSIDLGKNNEFKLLQDLCLGINVEFIEKYQFNENGFNAIMEYIKKLVGEQVSMETIKKLNSILVSSKENKKSIESLGLESIFIDAVKTTKKSQKAK